MRVTTQRRDVYSNALRFMSQFGGDARTAPSRAVVVSRMVHSFEGIFGVSRHACYSLLDQGRVRMDATNIPELIGESHYAEAAMPEGPLKLAMDIGGVVFVPTVFSPYCYFAIDDTGCLSEVPVEKYPLNGSVIGGYHSRYSGNFINPQENMNLFFTALSVPGTTFGVCRSDSFDCGQSVLLEGMEIGDLLNIAAIVGKFASNALADFLKNETTAQLAAFNKKKFDRARLLLQGIAHAMKNRLTPPIGHLQIGLEGNLEVAKDAIKRAVSFLFGTIEVVDLYAEPVKRGEFDIELNLAAVDDLKKIFSCLNDISGASFSAFSVPVFITDRNKLFDIVMELIMNAKKANPELDEEKKLRVDVKAETKDGRILFSVKDNGRGIKKEDLPRVFEPGFSTGGSGYGLAFFKSIVELLGGEMRVESEEGKGAAFYFTHPLDLKLPD